MAHFYERIFIDPLTGDATASVESRVDENNHTRYLEKCPFIEKILQESYNKDSGTIRNLFCINKLKKYATTNTLVLSLYISLHQMLISVSWLKALLK
jgi:hypothetical protein